LFLIVIMSSSHKIMGQWKNKPYVTAIGWLIVALMTVSGIAAIVSLA
jgi:Mn2+/Fe2+ NRAMP family transporter